MDTLCAEDITATDSQLLFCLKAARRLLTHPECWDQSGEGPGWCPIRAIAHEAAIAKLKHPFMLKLRATWLLRAMVPDSHRTWSPECVVRYNDDANVTHDEVLAWLDRTIAAVAKI